jgi:NAD(P)-dependent dehydrogenase (short-subunit alcohol dehydrogenase family)
MKVKSVFDKFKLEGKTAVVTGAAGLMGAEHCFALAEAEAKIALWDIDEKRNNELAENLRDKYSADCVAMQVDITDREQVEQSVGRVVEKYGGVDILINNAANDPKVSPDQPLDWARLEKLDISIWNKDIAVGLTGAFLCSAAAGRVMAKNGSGVILNIASDLGVIAPDQRIYEKDGVEYDRQPVKPVTYSVVKHGLIGLTKYIATYWAGQGVRCNALCPGGIYNGQPDEFVTKLTNLIPLGRMAERDEYRAAVLFLVSNASSYMTGALLSIDAGRSCW